MLWVTLARRIAEVQPPAAETRAPVVCVQGTSHMQERRWFHPHGGAEAEACPLDVTERACKAAVLRAARRLCAWKEANVEVASAASEALEAVWLTTSADMDSEMGAIGECSDQPGALVPSPAWPDAAHRALVRHRSGRRR